MMRHPVDEKSLSYELEWNQPHSWKNNSYEETWVNNIECIIYNTYYNKHPVLMVHLYI